MGKRQVTGILLLTLVCTSCILPALSAPPESGRKYAVKSNNLKKVYHKQPVTNNEQQPQLIEQPNKVSDGGNGSEMGPNFPWALAGPAMQLFRMFMGVPQEMNSNSLTAGVDKMDSGISPGQGFSWGQVIGYGLKLLFAALGGNSSSHDGIDKNDNVGANPMQGLMKTLIGTLVGNEEAAGGDNMAKQTGELINLALALMNALKTSFSQRAMRARSLGEKDRLTEITLSAIDMGKAYAKTFNTTDESCKKLHLCMAARECVKDVGQPNAFGLCHITSYATANLMYYTQSGSNEETTKVFLEATRRGRSQEECEKLYLCNETP